MTADIQTILQLLQRQSALIPPAYSLVTASAEYQEPAVRVIKKLQPAGSIKTDRSFSPSSQVSVCPIRSKDVSQFFSSYEEEMHTNLGAGSQYFKEYEIIILTQHFHSGLRHYSFRGHVFYESHRDSYNDVIIRQIYFIVIFFTKVSRKGIQVVRTFRIMQFQSYALKQNFIFKNFEIHTLRLCLKNNQSFRKGCLYVCLEVILANLSDGKDIQTSTINQQNCI